MGWAAFAPAGWTQKQEVKDVTTFSPSQRPSVPVASCVLCALAFIHSLIHSALPRSHVPPVPAMDPAQQQSWTLPADEDTFRPPGGAHPRTRRDPALGPRGCQLLRHQPWETTSQAPGSSVLTDGGREPGGSVHLGGICSAPALLSLPCLLSGDVLFFSDVNLSGQHTASGHHFLYAPYLIISCELTPRADFSHLPSNLTFRLVCRCPHPHPTHALRCLSSGSGWQAGVHPPIRRGRKSANISCFPTLRGPWVWGIFSPGLMS